MKQARMAVIGGVLILGTILGVLTGGEYLASSSISASLESCRNRSITDKATCEPLLLAEKKRLENSIQSWNKKISNKEDECKKYAKQNKQPQLRRCRDTVRDMRSDVRSSQQQLKTVESALAGLTQTVSVTLRNCCADVRANNYDSTCGKDSSSQAQASLCRYSVSTGGGTVVSGCMNASSPNYNPRATQDDGSCEENTSLLCMDSLATNFLGLMPCIYPNREGCTDRMANNYNSTATIDNGSCTYDQEPLCNGEKDHGYDPASKTCMTCYDKQLNGDEEEIDCGGSKCEKCLAGCKDSSATNFNPEAKKEDSTLCVYNITDTPTVSYTCPDQDALNYQENDGSDPNRIADEKVCDYCGLSQSIQDIQNKQGTKVKTRIGKMNQEQKDSCKREICNLSNIEVSACTIATVFKPQYGYLQMYLALSGQSFGALDGVYRSSKEITLTPDADDSTREAFVRYAGNTQKLNEIKNECPFVRELLGKELIKDYKTENTDRIKVTQMALTMKGLYSGAIDGDKAKTYNLLKDYYKWTDKKFGPVYIAGKSWQVARATRFGYNDPVDNGVGTPFMDPAGKGISTNNTSLQGASLPLPVTVKILCPNIVTEIGKYIASQPGAHELSMCQKMLSSSDPFNPAGTGEYSGLAVLSLCIEYANKAGYTTCRDKHHQARVKVSSMDKNITIPLVDIGPSESAWNNQKEATIDLTYGAIKDLSGGDGMLYEACFELIP